LFAHTFSARNKSALLSLFEVGHNRTRRIEGNQDLTLVVARLLPQASVKALCEGKKARSEEGAKAAELGAYATIPAVAGSVATEPAYWRLPVPRRSGSWGCVTSGSDRRRSITVDTSSP